MQDLVIKAQLGTYFIPQVHFNATTGVCLIAGESYIEDTDAFYLELYNWVEEYMNQPGKEIDFNFKLTYFNTSSQKGILILLKKLKDFQNAGRKVEVTWHYPEDDDDNLMEAEDFMADSKMYIKLKSYDSSLEYA